MSTNNTISKSEFVVYGKGKNEEAINISNVFYISRPDKHVIFHMENNIFKHSGTLIEFEEILPDNFFRIHREYIVNMEYVACIYKTYLKLVNGIEIPISRMHREQIQEFITQHAR